MKRIYSTSNSCKLDIEESIQSLFHSLDLDYVAGLFRDFGEEISRIRIYIDIAVQEVLQNASLFDRQGKQQLSITLHVRRKSG